MATRRRRPTRAEKFATFADKANYDALRGDMFRRSMGGTDNGEHAETKLTFRELLSEEVKETIVALLGDSANAQAEAIDEAMANINESMGVAMAAAPEITIEEPQNIVSMLDAITLGRVTKDDIDAFLRSYKRNLNKPQNFNYIRDIMQKAIEFFDEHIGNARRKVHKNLRTTSKKGIYKLFEAAAGQHGIPLTAQACALLRIMAIINFIKSDSRLALIPTVNHHLEEMRRKHFRKTHGVTAYRTGHPSDDTIKVLQVAIHTKTLESMILKLLVKPTNRTSEVMDQMRARFITETPRETLKLIHRMFFHPHAIFPATNIIAGKTKNQMIDPQAIESIVFEGNDEEAAQMFESLSQPMEKNPDNPHSHAEYEAIHMTFDMPIEIEGGIILSFPVEFQFLHLKAHEANRVVAPHDEYKAEQGEAATQRALGHNLVTAFATQEHRSKR